MLQPVEIAQEIRPFDALAGAAELLVQGLALTLAKALNRLCAAKGFRPECQPLLNDLDRLPQATIEKDGKVITTRTYVAGQVGNVFKAAGVTLPHNISEQSAD